MHLMKKLILSFVTLLSCLALDAQNQKRQDKDSLVVLLSSRSMQMVDVEGARTRKVIGPARFLHNDTYLLCDTALWNVETQIIEAWGNVSILQDETVLTSDNLKYLINEDIAQFRGSVVQLTDKDHNTLRTRHLDYNTKDSVAIFKNGGAMRDKDGQIIESRDGTYDSKIKKFSFVNDVNMFTDSIFVKTRELVYESDLNLATFGHATDAWQENNMLSSNRGWYDRGRELFFFSDNVHVMSEDQEGWCDSLFFHRNTSDVEMLGNAQVNDTTRNVFGLAGRIQYEDSLSKVTMTRKPAVISQTTEQDESTDTVYLGADKLVYYTVMRFEVDSAAVLDAQKRLKSLEVDPVGTFRKKAAEEAAKAKEEAMKDDPNYQGAKKAAAGGGRADGPAGARRQSGPAARPQKLSAAPPVSSERSGSFGIHGIPKMVGFADSLSVVEPALDSLALTDSLRLTDSLKLADSLRIADSLHIADSIANLPKDSTRIGFLEAIGKVKVFKKNMQVVCDSLLYTDLDSLARLFKEPIVWQETVRQYTADSISLVVSDGAMEKASLMSNAFIAIEEDPTHFDQIKGAEMLAYFDDNGGLKRFDVLGGATALFFLEENGSLATVNKTDSKMLSAVFKDGEIQRIYYFEEAKNDGYPVVQLSEEERQLKGFNWQPDKRPADRNVVTPLSLRPSERTRYAARPKAKYKQTDIYFPGYMNDVYRQIEVRDSLRRIREQEKALAEMEDARKARLDSLALDESLMTGDSLALADSLGSALDSLLLTDSLSVADSLAVSDSVAVTDSAFVGDSASVNLDKVMTPEEIKAEKARLKAEEKAKRKAEAEKKRQERIARKEARWAELDKRDAEKLAAKEEKRKEKERKRKRKALEKAGREAAKDNETLERYKRKFERQKARETARAAQKASRK